MENTIEKDKEGGGSSSYTKEQVEEAKKILKGYKICAHCGEFQIKDDMVQIWGKNYIHYFCDECTLFCSVCDVRYTVRGFREHETCGYDY